MFGRSNKPGEARAPITSSQSRPTLPASILAQDLTIKGDLTSDGDLHIDGVVTGAVRARQVTLGETGRIEGDIQADAVDISGRVLGSVDAARVRLTPTSHVAGDVTHEQLTIETGASFEGRSIKRPPAASADLVMLTTAARQG